MFLQSWVPFCKAAKAADVLPLKISDPLSPNTYGHAVYKSGDECTYLDLAVASEGLGVSGQTSGVPAIVTWELSLEVAGGCARQGAEVQWAVGAVPHAGGGG